MSATNPDRPYYVRPALDSDWAFGEPAKAASTPVAPHAAPSLRVAPSNRYEESLSSPYGDLGAAPTAGTLLRAFATSSVLSWTSTALVMPFEVGKTLAQVQWVPRDGLEPVVWAGSEDVVEEEVVEVSQCVGGPKQGTPL